MISSGHFFPLAVGCLRNPESEEDCKSGSQLQEWVYSINMSVQWLCKPQTITQRTRGKIQGGDQQAHFLSGYHIYQKMWVTDFSDCNHPAAHSYPVLYSQHINLDKQDGAFNIYSGRRSENHLPRRLHYLSIISTRQKTFPTFWDWGQERGDCGSLLQPVHLH